MKMQKAIRLLAGVVLAGALAGCEWETTSSGDSASTSGYFVNFSGVYRGAPGSYLVSDYSLNPAGSDQPSTDDDSIAVVGENQGSASGTSSVPLTKFGGTLSRRPIVAGSVTVFMRTTAGDLVGTFNDTGGGQLQGTALLEGVVPLSGLGEINYATGAWYVNLPLPGLVGTFNLTVNYRYDPNGGSSSGSTDARPGSTGGSIYSFTVQHEGSSLKIIDNNGMEYVGTAGEPVFTSENLETQTTTDGSSDTISQDGPVTMSFSVTGTSIAGFTVNMVGSFNGFYTEDQRLINRTISGTWIEVGGKTGDIYGIADDSTASN